MTTSIKTLAAVSAVVTCLATGAFARAGPISRCFDWSGYEDQGFYQSYIAKHKEAPTYTYFGSQEEAFTKLTSGFTPDLAHPCTDGTRKWVAAGLLKPLDTSKLEHWDKIAPALQNLDGIVVDGEVYMLPFEWGNTGLIYRTDKITEDEISLQLTADPQYAGQVAIPDAAATAYAFAALATGITNHANMTDEEFQKASDFLRSVHPNIRFYWSDPGQLDQALASGEILMGWGWNQSELNLVGNGTPALMMKDVNKGIATWVCGYVHMADAGQPDELVYDQLNALSAAESGKYIVEAWGYAHANTEAMSSVDPELLKNYGFDKMDEFFEKSLLFTSIEPELDAKMLKEFERIKAGF